jgi:hypothetical protein
MFRLQIVAIIRELYYYEDTSNVSYILTCLTMLSVLQPTHIGMLGYGE